MRTFILHLFAALSLPAMVGLSAPTDLATERRAAIIATNAAVVIVAPVSNLAAQARSLALDALARPVGVSTAFVQSAIAPVAVLATNAYLSATLNTNHVDRIWDTLGNQTFVTVNGENLDVWEISLSPVYTKRVYFSSNFASVYYDPNLGLVITNVPPQSSYDFPFTDGDWSGFQDPAQFGVYHASGYTMPWLSPDLNLPAELVGAVETGNYGTAVVTNEVSSFIPVTNLVGYIQSVGLNPLNPIHTFQNALGISTTNVLWASVINSLVSETIGCWTVVTNVNYATPTYIVSSNNLLFYHCSWLATNDLYDTVWVDNPEGDITHRKVVFIECTVKNTSAGDLTATTANWGLEAYGSTFVQEGSNPDFGGCGGFHNLGTTKMYLCTVVQTNSPYRTLEGWSLFNNVGLKKYLDSCTMIHGTATNILDFTSVSSIYVNNCTGFVGAATGNFSSALAVDARLNPRYIMEEVASKKTVSSITNSIHTLELAITDKVNVNSGAATNLSVFSSLNLLGKQVAWNSDKATFDIPLDNGVVLQLGQEQHLWVRNQTGSTLGNGKIVCSAGAVGDNAAVRLANSTDSSCAWGVLGIVTQDDGIDHGSNGYITTMGEVNNLALPAAVYQPSNTLWLATDGNYTNIEPSGVAAKYKLGTVLRAHSTEGRILFKPEFVPAAEDVGAASTNQLQNYVTKAEYTNTINGIVATQAVLSARSTAYVYVHSVTSGVIVTVSPTQTVYRISVSAANTVSNDISFLAFDGTKDARWELWVNYTSTNALSTRWDARMEFGCKNPVMTVTGLYKFACSTFDGVRIEARQIYPSRCMWDGIPAYQTTSYSSVPNVTAVPLYTATTLTNVVGFSSFSIERPILIRFPTRATNASNIGIYTNIVSVYLTSIIEGGGAVNVGFLNYAIVVDNRQHYPGMIYAVVPALSERHSYKLGIQTIFANPSNVTGSGVYADGMFERRDLNELEYMLYNANGTVPTN